MIIIVLQFLINLIVSKEITSFNFGILEAHSKDFVPKQIQSLANQDIKLDCHRPDLEELPKNSIYSWVFYPLSENLLPGKEPISITLCGATDLPACNKKLNLKKVNNTSSGLYKCSVLMDNESGYVMTAKPINSFILEVEDQEPKFIEGPKDMKVYEDVNGSLECKVQSELPIIIKWFKRDNYPMLNVAVIHYNNNTYRPLKNVKEYTLGNIYVSKLVFNKFYKNDSGVYACSFVTPSGQILYKEGSITVQQTLVIFSSLVQDKWEIFAAVLVVIVLVLVTIGCMFALCFKKIWEKNDEPLNALRKQNKYDPDGNETSEYEHVVI